MPTYYSLLCPKERQKSWSVIKDFILLCRGLTKIVFLCRGMANTMFVVPKTSSGALNLKGERERNKWPQGGSQSSSHTSICSWMNLLTHLRISAPELSSPQDQDSWDTSSVRMIQALMQSNTDTTFKYTWPSTAYLCPSARTLQCPASEDCSAATFTLQTKKSECNSNDLLIKDSGRDNHIFTLHTNTTWCWVLLFGMCSSAARLLSNC